MTIRDLTSTDKFFLLAGPCVIESEDMAMRIAEKIVSITADRGIHRAAREAGINSLLIGAGNVSLDPYEYGFIGGATGTFKNKVFFCGDLEEHPDKQKIVEFISACGKECVFLPFERLTDTGSILFV